MKTNIEMAQEAGWEYADGDDGYEPLWRFAELVRADERDRAMRENAYVLAEREACAAKAEQVGQHKNHIGIAAAIRARGQA